MERMQKWDLTYGVEAHSQSDWECFECESNRRAKASHLKYRPASGHLQEHKTLWFLKKNLKCFL